MKGGGGNHGTSIVDLLRLLDMDSSLAARKELANELHVHARGVLGASRLTASVDIAMNECSYYVP